VVATPAINTKRGVTSPLLPNLEKGTSCGYTKSTDLNADPKLSKLANSGDPTNTYALERGNAAIDAGGDPFLATDQCDVTPPQGAANSPITPCS